MEEFNIFSLKDKSKPTKILMNDKENSTNASIL